MLKVIEYEQIDKDLIDKNYVLIDVRSPKEFKGSTIPGAVNIPIFDDKQRELIGTVYVNESVEKAKKLGVEAASKNLPYIYERVEELKKEFDSLIFFCARGGLRSTSVASLLSSLGVKVAKIRNGYKGYRGYINKALPEVVSGVKFVVIHGNTGMGKTKMLEELKSMGHDILDLEGCANHRGSLLGSVGLGNQNSQKQFESLVYDSLKNRKGNLVFVEGESKRIGRIMIPDHIYNPMREGIHIKVEGNIDFRVKNIMEDYIREDNDELIEALNKLRRYINDNTISEYEEKIKKGNYATVISDLMIRYYDPMYENKKYNFKLSLQVEDIKKACIEIEKWAENLEI